MEISPVAGIRVLPVTKVPPIDAELTAAFDIQANARPDDDSYSSGNRKAAGAEEPDEEDLEEVPDQDSISEPVAAHPKPREGNQISFFA